ncbi:MAG: hypothetical protein IAB75_02120 [Bacteroidetes bacterium]|uniref:Uncharacterized protein n=1 Tax=Candidatus Cryptobacteroides avicola TaxID=2840757 RepID=A0A940DSC6_9BACT|nr:hypothetical protein [Candidatus Cryptobacteroides avicola]
MDRFCYVYDILAAEYAPPDVYECEDEPGVFCGNYPYEVNHFIDMADGRIPNDFPCPYEKFRSDGDISGIVDAYNERIDELNARPKETDAEAKPKKYDRIDIEALYYAVMFVYYLTERKCTDVQRSPGTIRQQLQNLRDHLSEARRFTIVTERLKTEEKDGQKTYSYVKDKPLEISGQTLIENLTRSVDKLLEMDCLPSRYKYDDEHEPTLDIIEIDIFAKEDRVTYAPTRKAKVAMDMLKYLFSNLNLPDLRARKCLDVSEFDEKDERSYSINRLIAVSLNLMRYSDRRSEDLIKSLSKYKNFDPNTLEGL